MRHDTYTEPSAITRLVGQLRATQAANPSSLVRRYMDDPALYRRAREEARQQAALRFPHLFDPDLLRRLTATDVVIGHDDSAENAEPVEPVKPTRRRKPTLAGVIRQMRRAGVEIAGCEINPRDGTVKVITGKPVGASDTDVDDTTPIDRSEWK